MSAMLKLEAILEEQANLELGTVDTKQILTLLECPVCLDHITPPIKQCVKGHLVCSDCFPRLPHCPTCRSMMSQERNLGMEQVSRLLNFPCRYHPMGCTVAAPLNKKAEHEGNCEYLQLKCPFHGQCSFCGPLSLVVPHLKADHQVTPVPIQPSGVLFYRAKTVHKRHLWVLLFEWDKNLFKLIVKHVPANTVGRQEGSNLLVAHVQYIGSDSMAAQYAYQISLFDADRKKNGPKFEGIVSSTMKPLESQVAKSEVFVANNYTARDYTDQFANLNFIIKMRSLKEGKTVEDDIDETATTADRSRDSRSQDPSRRRTGGRARSPTSGAVAGPSGITASSDSVSPMTEELSSATESSLRTSLEQQPPVSVQS